MGILLRELSESYSMNTNMTVFIWFLRNICVLVLRTKVAPALKGSNHSTTRVAP